jgi:hypothetical protein
MPRSAGIVGSAPTGSWVPGIKRARRFRREYSGPATSYAREFDGQLQTALQ